MGRSKSSRARLTRWIVPVVIVAAIAAHDFAVKPGHGFAARSALLVISEYQTHVSPRLGFGRKAAMCRFKPSCSSYGRTAIAKYGLLKGGAKTAWRIVRCNPLTPKGTVDKP